MGLGPDVRLNSIAYDGRASSGRSLRTSYRGQDHHPAPIAVSYLAQAPGALDLRPGLRSGHLDVDGDMLHRCCPGCPRSHYQNDLRMSQTGGQRCATSAAPRPLFPRVAPPPAGGHPRRAARFTIGARHSKQPRREADPRTTTTCPTRSTSGCSGPRMAYTCAVLSRATPRWKRRRQTSRPGRPQARPQARACDCSTSAAAGAAWSCTRRRSTASKALGVTLSARAGRVGARPPSSARASGPAEVRTWTTATYRDRLRRGQLHRPDRARRKTNVPVYFQFLRQAEARRRLLNHCITRPRQHRDAHHAARVHQPLRLPRRRAEGPGDLVRSCTTRLRRCGTRRTCASTTPRPWPPGAPTWTRTGTRRSQEVGEGTARVWRLTWRARVLGFDRNQIQLHQVLGVRLLPTSPQACRCDPMGAARVLAG